MNNEKILIVDDEEGLRKLLKVTLNKERYYNLFFAASGKETLEILKKDDPFDLILLDVMLPDITGFDLCGEIRKISPVPIIFLTACSSDYDKLSGLTIGADDYITKPFHAMEVIARIKAIFRRRKLDYDMLSNQSSHKIYEYDTFKFAPSRASLVVKGHSFKCTAKELELLEFFCRHPNKVFTTTQLYDLVWRLPGIGGEKTVTIYISKLRKKLLDDENPKIIVNLRGIGYKFVPPKGLE